MNIKRFNQFNESKGLTRKEKEQTIVEYMNSQDGETSLDPESLSKWSDDDVNSLYTDIFGDKIQESETGAVTTASPGGGTAVGGGASGSFTTAMGVSVSGGDSGSAFSTNSNTNGMGQIVSSQPSDVPGDVRGSTKGSGDIGTTIGAYGKTSAGGSKKKKEKKNSKRSKTAAKIDNLYVTNYKENINSDGKIIQNWKTFKESNDVDIVTIDDFSKDDLERKANKASNVTEFINKFKLDGYKLESPFDFQEWFIDYKRINEK